MWFVHPLQVAYLAATSDQRFGDATTSAAPGAHNGTESLRRNYRIAIMRQLFIGAALAALVGSPVLAADQPVKAPPAPIYSWEGFYVGGNVGWLGIEGVSLSGTHDPRPRWLVGDAEPSRLRDRRLCLGCDEPECRRRFPVALRNRQRRSGVHGRGWDRRCRPRMGFGRPLERGRRISLRPAGGHQSHPPDRSSRGRLHSRRRCVMSAQCFGIQLHQQHRTSEDKLQNRLNPGRAERDWSLASLQSFASLMRINF
jgi:hypothetical protein